MLVLVLNGFEVEWVERSCGEIRSTPESLRMGFSGVESIWDVLN
jgi:hypothetical protein